MTQPTIEQELKDVLCVLQKPELTYERNIVIKAITTLKNLPDNDLPNEQINMRLLKAAQHMLESLDKVSYRDSANYRMGATHPAYENLKQATTQAAVKVALRTISITDGEPTQ